LSKVEENNSLRRGTRKGGKHSSRNKSSSTTTRHRSRSSSKHDGRSKNAPGEHNISYGMDNALNALKLDDSKHKRKVELSVCESTAES
jgi:hypothetical protein